MIDGVVRKTKKEIWSLPRVMHAFGCNGTIVVKLSIMDISTPLTVMLLVPLIELLVYLLVAIIHESGGMTVTTGHCIITRISYKGRFLFQGSQVLLIAVALSSKSTLCYETLFLDTFHGSPTILKKYL